MSPHYDRHSEISKGGVAQDEMLGGPEDAALDDAAEALRETEIEAVQPGVPPQDWPRLEELSIDELRKIAAKLDIPDRGQIVEQDKLIAEIRQRM